MTYAFTGCDDNQYRDDFFLYQKHPDGSWRVLYGIVNMNMTDPDAAPDNEVCLEEGERVAFNQDFCVLCQGTNDGTLALFVEDMAMELLAESAHPRWDHASR
ncbi:hypothetical protein [Paraliomyxa miuraensis]|uniref:hypothetical protein n=1 Tax=Paraliomyxa miuraensis TaxID=376150 RepID=UPI00225B230D|nr:hypothetical protein [Paraliomyxa miuraensis]MCX4246355.1 hypothetical protein [Paraliomyxa miuraensis]